MVVRRIKLVPDGCEPAGLPHLVDLVGLSFSTSADLDVLVSQREGTLHRAPRRWNSRGQGNRACGRGGCPGCGGRFGRGASGFCRCLSGRNRRARGKQVYQEGPLHLETVTPEWFSFGSLSGGPGWIHPNRRKRFHHK